MSSLEIHCYLSLVIDGLLNRMSPLSKTRAARILPYQSRANFLIQWNQKIDPFNKDLNITLLRTGIHLVLPSNSFASFHFSSSIKSNIQNCQTKTTYQRYSPLRGFYGYPYIQGYYYGYFYLGSSPVGSTLLQSSQIVK
jgi:hypothetical protein